MALTEACANAVEHGGGDTGSGPASEAYRVTAYLDGETCRIEVADAGPGFSGARLPAAAAADAENGRGLRLIEELADHVHFGRTGRGGALVGFDKIVKWRADAPLALT